MSLGCALHSLPRGFRRVSRVRRVTHRRATQGNLEEGHRRGRKRVVFKGGRTYPSQVSALSPTLGNKGKKKTATGRKPNGWKRARSIEEDRDNAALESSIEEEKENKMHQLAPGEDEAEQFDLAVEGQISERFEPECDGKQNSVTPKSPKNAHSSEPATPTRHGKHTYLHLA